MGDEVHILLAEEDSEDAMLTQLALKLAHTLNPVHVVTSAAQVVSYLEGEGPYADRRAYAMPAIIILALRLPMLHGFDVLRWIRGRSEFDAIRITILAGTRFPNEERFARELGADRYAVKPSEFSQLVTMAEQMRNDWLHPQDSHQSLQFAE